MEDENYIFYVNNDKYIFPKIILNNHPGGINTLIEINNCDCTKHYYFHSVKSKNKWNKYIIKKKNIFEKIFECFLILLKIEKI